MADLGLAGGVVGRNKSHVRGRAVAEHTQRCQKSNVLRVVVKASSVLLHLGGQTAEGRGGSVDPLVLDCPSRKVHDRFVDSVRLSERHTGLGSPVSKCCEVAAVVNDLLGERVLGFVSPFERCDLILEVVRGDRLDSAETLSHDGGPEFYGRKSNGERPVFVAFRIGSFRLSLERVGVVDESTEERGRDGLPDDGEHDGVGFGEWLTRQWRNAVLVGREDRCVAFDVDVVFHSRLVRRSLREFLGPVRSWIV